MRLWQEWIRLEVAYVEKLRARWEVLGIHSNSTAPSATGAASTDVGDREIDAEKEVDEQEEATIDVPLLPNETVADKEGENPASLSGTEAILDGAVVRVVVDNTLSCSFVFD